jgi:hypothetical protein
VKILYTVVLLRPKYLCSDVEYGIDTYTAQLALDPSKAFTDDIIWAAREEAYQADRKAHRNGDVPRGPKLRADYKVCMIFEGHPKIVLFGWQA